MELMDDMVIKVGDMIYFSRHGNLRMRQPVIRITPTMIKTESYTMKGDSTYLRVIGQGTWSAVSASVETEELKVKWDEIMLRKWIADNWHNVSLDDIAMLKDKYSKDQD